MLRQGALAAVACRAPTEAADVRQMDRRSGRRGRRRRRLRAHGDHGFGRRFVRWREEARIEDFHHVINELQGGVENTVCHFRLGPILVGLIITVEFTVSGARGA